MERFNTTTAGYKFDKVIFFGILIIILSVLIYQFSIYGFTYKPYFVCHGPGECLNPFDDSNMFGCTWAFGFKECEIEGGAWLSAAYLPPGEYGQKPPSNTAFMLLLFGGFLAALGGNHLLHNKGKAFHLNVFDKLKKITEDDDNESD